MDSDMWPLVGRDGLVATVLGHLADPACQGIYLVGEPGVGTTRAMGEVLDRLTADGRRSNRVVATEGQFGDRFGALAPFIPGDVPPTGTPLDALDLFERIRERVGTPRRPTERFVAGVDNLRWLDVGSVGLLTQLVAAGLAVVLATVRPDDPLPEAHETLERSFTIRRVDVGPLGGEDTMSLVDTALSEAVDGMAARTLAATSGGNPRYLAELITGSVAAGTLSTAWGMWTLSGRPGVTAKLERMLEAALAGLDDDERQLAELIALAEPVPIDALAAAQLIDGAVDLEEHGVLETVSGRPACVRFAQPLIAMQLRERMSPLRRRVAIPHAIRLVELHPMPGDDLRLALWKLENGLDVDVDQLERAAAIARGRNDFDSTGRLASAAAALEPTLHTLVLHAEALHDLCEFDDAEAVLAHADSFVDNDFDLLRIAILRHRILLWGRLDGDASAAAIEIALETITEPMMHDLAHVALANTYAFSGRPALVESIVPRLIGGNAMVEIGLAFPRALGAQMTGRVEEALEIARVGATRRLLLPADAPIGHIGLSGLAVGVVLTELGRFVEAEEVLAAAYSEVVANSVPQLQIWLSLARGRTALYAGRIGDARRWFIEARALAEPTRFVVGLRNALTGLLVCAGHLGDIETTREARRALDALDPDHGYLWPEHHLGIAWAEFTEGSTDAAIARLLLGADAAERRGETVMCAAMLYEAARFGAAREVLGRLEQVAANIDGGLMRARLAFVQGAAAADPQRLATAETRFAELGAMISAAECASELARVHHAKQRVRDSQGAALRSAQHRAGLAAVFTPRLVEPATQSRLTSREHEIATLAVSGLASKAIAQRLELSVRTVSNHLQNVYLKLGIAGRDDLAETMRSEPVPR